MAEETRIDKWLWAVRIFKTRSQAIEACKAGHIKINGVSVKPSHQVKIGEVVIIQRGELARTIKVIGIISQRVSAKVAAQYVEDLTPPEEYQKLKEKRQSMPYYFEPGYGRPTKRDRRMMKKYGLL
ncbi:MAG: RNA-binding S4 domain-containing protein [Verrucomicrobiia bacterium]